VHIFFLHPDSIRFFASSAIAPRSQYLMRTEFDGNVNS